MATIGENSRNSSSFREQSPNGSRRIDIEVFSDNHINGGSLSKQNEFYSDPDPQEYEKISIKQVSVSKEDGDSKDCDYELELDSYNMILVTKPLSLNFLYLMLCVLFQYMLLILLLFNLLHDQTDNVLKIPPGVEFEVRVGQLLAVILAAMTADDVLGSITMLYIGLNRDVLEMIPNASFASWCIAFVAKFLEGSACLFIIFVLIVQAADVISLCLNFAALSFVWAIDDVFYSLSKNGFMTKSLAVLADSIAEIRLPNPSKQAIRGRNIFYYIMTSVYIIFWAVLVQQQVSGKFLCNTLLIQFGDEYEPLTSRFSGVYKLTSERLSIHGYVVYESDTDIGPGSDYAVPVIAYCSDEGAWTLSFKYDNETDYSPCRWTAISPDTGTFDVTTVPGRWLVKKEQLSGTLNNGYLPYMNMKLECIDCIDNSNPSRGSCSDDAGYCVNNRCICKEGRFGLSCEYLTPCDELHVFGADAGFSAIPGGHMSFKGVFNLQTRATGSIVTVKDKPVYYQPISATHYVIIFFNGLRWVLTSSASFAHFADYNEFNFQKKLADYMHTDFHPFWSEYVGYFMSESMLLSSPSDRVTPSLLRWYSASPSGELLFKYQGAVDEFLPHIPALACAGCSMDHLCRHGGACENGRCVCKNNCTYGYYCEDVDPSCTLLEIWGFSQ